MTVWDAVLDLVLGVSPRVVEQHLTDDRTPHDDEDLGDALAVCSDVRCPCEVRVRVALTDEQADRLLWWVQGSEQPGEG